MLVARVPNLWPRLNELNAPEIDPVGPGRDFRDSVLVDRREAGDSEGGVERGRLSVTWTLQHRP